MTLAACFKKPVALQVLEEDEDEFLAADRAMKVRERLAKKVVEKKKTFQFNFSVADAPEEGEQAQVEGSSSKAMADKRKKKQRHREKKKAAAKDVAPSIGTASTDAAPTVAEEQKVAAAVVAKDPTSDGLAIERPASVPDAVCPRSPLVVFPPPGFEDCLPTSPAAVAEKKEDEVQESEGTLSLEDRLRIAKAQSEKKARKDRKKKKRGKGQDGVAVAAYRQAQQDEVTKKLTSAEPLVQFSSWKDQAISEEERAKRRFGQGTRNLSALACRKSQGEKGKGVGVIGGVTSPAKDTGEKALEEVTTAFSFGFSL